MFTSSPVSKKKACIQERTVSVTTVEEVPLALILTMRANRESERFSPAQRLAYSVAGLLVYPLMKWYTAWG